MDPLAAVSTRTTPQSERADPRQVANSAGGFSFPVGVETLVHRFLTIGVASGTYYASEQEVTRESAGVVLDVARERGEWLVEQIVSVSTAGRAPRQNPAIFALAAVSGLGDEAARKAAREALPVVCRTGTHLFTFARYVEQFRGWGRGLRSAVADWYTAKPVDAVAYQAVKYRQRDGWTHRDLLRLAHPLVAEPVDPGDEDHARRALFGWIVDGMPESGAEISRLPEIVQAFERAQRATTVHDAVHLAATTALPWEAYPDAALREPEVWRALIEQGMPQTALMRQLPRLTTLGVLDDRATRHRVAVQLENPADLRRGRVHPMNVLVAQRTYASGRSVRGSGTWTPKAFIVDALDAAFYTAFGTIQPAGKRTLLALDVSGSMTYNQSGLTGIDCREASAALALVTMATEPYTTVVGFTAGRGSYSERGGIYTGSGGISELAISPRQRLDDAIATVSNLPFGDTDCALPMLWAMEHRQEFDTFVVLTDNETWAGSIHPHQALKQYREKTGIPARLVVVGMATNSFSIADPTDAGMLDIAGLDSAVPSLISDFSRGDV